MDDTTVQALRQRFGVRGLIELTGSIGYYAMLAMTVNACELPAGRARTCCRAGDGHRLDVDFSAPWASY